MKTSQLTDQVLIGLSTVADGNMKALNPDDADHVFENQTRFLNRSGFVPDQTYLFWLDYDKTDFCHYQTVNSTPDRAMQKMVGVDGLATATRGLGLFLPLADCLGAVIYDPVSRGGVLMVSHLGRHATEQHGATKSIEFMTSKFGTDPAKVKIWLSPVAGECNYPLYKFENRSLRDVNVEHFVAAGVNLANIVGGDIDTTTDSNYFSHSCGDCNKRFAIVAKMI